VVLREVVVPDDVVVEDLVVVVVLLVVVVVSSSLEHPQTDTSTRRAMKIAVNFLIVSLTFCLAARIDIS